MENPEETCRPAPFSPVRRRPDRNVYRWLRIAALSSLVAGWLTGCGDHKFSFDNKDRALEQAEQKKAAQDYRGAISLYEKSFDGTSKSADAHFRMGIIYDENLSDAVGAVHHFKRYLEILPNGPHAKEAKANLARIELTLATNLAGGTLISHREAVRLKQENKDLHDQLTARNNPATAAASPAAASGPAAGKAAARDAERKPPAGTRTYQVQKGDTLASIARKFYKDKTRAKDIQDANLNSVPDPKKLKLGQTLIIP